MFLENLKALSLANGSSGDEAAVRSVILSLLREIPDCEAVVDGVGNVLVKKQGASPAEKKLMFCARMDEAGFIVMDETRWFSSAPLYQIRVRGGY